MRSRHRGETGRKKVNRRERAPLRAARGRRGSARAQPRARTCIMASSMVPERVPRLRVALSLETAPVGAGRCGPDESDGQAMRIRSAFEIRRSAMRATTRHQQKCRALCEDPCAKFPSDCWVPRPRGSPRVRAPPRTPRRAKNATGAASDADSHQGTSRRRRAADLDRSPSRDRACDHLARRLASSQHITCFADREKRGPRSRLADDPPPSFPSRAARVSGRTTWIRRR